MFKETVDKENVWLGFKIVIGLMFIVALWPIIVAILTFLFWLMLYTILFIVITASVLIGMSCVGKLYHKLKGAL